MDNKDPNDIFGDILKNGASQLGGSLGISNITLIMSMISKTIDIAIIASFISFFSSIQTIFLVFWLTDVIDWHPIWVFSPVILMPIIYFIRSQYKKTMLERREKLLEAQTQKIMSTIDQGGNLDISEILRQFRGDKDEDQ